ncbi:Acyl-CoA dehydrogenase [Archaeoglobus sulfaticallidus PM70-1]|uniref:Acyl-CoA dehydrogenase n=1 Tax=Archaeoglobus sulfaticallidus PM70-1 TaxID=387631 RepID=N0BEG7_9EURY|nr:acyl-CoA dehydrogenase family protein [Archaeoglobus sulfaticallidus]AGK61408.1 Acyl-CoA dehydrogenase [Archaeoglobus sulfaticallidus PM70-1]
MAEFEEAAKEVVEFVKTKAVEIDRNNEMDKSVLEELFGKKLMGVIAPQRYGGLGMGYVEASRLVEELAKVSAAVAHSVFVHNIAADAILKFGSEEQKRKYLKSLTSRKLGAVAITEPSGGSDVANAIKLRAEKKGDKYIMNGTKMFITNSTHADIFIVVARTGEGRRGLTALIVEKNDGIEVIKLNPSGMRGSGLGTVRFKDVEVPEENVLLEEGKGLRVALGILAPGRIPFAAMGLGIAEGCFEHVLNYVKKRGAFGQKILNFQAVQFMLAEVAADIEATKILIYHAAELAKENDVTVLAAMTKLKSAELAKKVADVAVELHGGYGILSNTLVDRAYRDAKTLDIAEGTSEMMKLIISRALLS